MLLNFDGQKEYSIRKQSTAQMSEALTRQQFFDLLDNVDFKPVIAKLSERLTWSSKSALTACEQYKKFLFLQYKYADQRILVPSEEIDEFWHEHILFTKQYAQDCELLFGAYLHHQPSLKSITNSKHVEHFETTQALYFREFGEYIYEIRLIMLFKRFFRLKPFHISRKLIANRNFKRSVTESKFYMN